MRWIPRFHHVILLLLISMTAIMFKVNTHFKSPQVATRIEAKRKAAEQVKPSPVDQEVIRAVEKLQLRRFEDDSGKVYLQQPPPPEVKIIQPAQLPAVSSSKKVESGSEPNPEPEPEIE